MGGLFIASTLREIRKQKMEKKGLCIAGEIISYSIAPLKIITGAIIAFTIPINKPLEAVVVASVHIDVIVMLALFLIVGAILK